MDESGHDHRNCPYEVRGGITLHTENLWPFIKAMQNLEEATFGVQLHKHGGEIKGHKLLDKDRFKWAAQAPELDEEARRKHCISFLNKKLDRRPPTFLEFTAYGQASLRMARGVFELLREHKATIFASAIPRGVQKPAETPLDDILRKDFVFLFERFFYFLESREETWTDCYG